MTEISFKLHEELGEDVASLSDDEQDALERCLITAAANFIEAKGAAAAVESEQQRLKEEMNF